MRTASMSKTAFVFLPAFISLLPLVAAGVAHADGSPPPPASNQVINVQGVLRNGVGALQTMPFGLDVALFPTSGGGTAFFTQHFTTVAVENGYFSIELSGDLGFSG